jgi:expansin (peptidoglycan-binding protein)
MFRLTLFAPLCLALACSGPASFGQLNNDANPRDAGPTDGRTTIDAAGTRDSISADSQIDSKTLTEALPTSCSGICNAIKPTYPTIGEVSFGDITTYSTRASEGGACNYGKTGVMYYAASNVNVTAGDNQGQWQGGRFCGQCVEIAALTREGARTVVVRIMDRCADEWCGMDLGGDATGVIMGSMQGRYQGAWRLVSCDGHPEVSDGPPILFVNSGSNPHWALVQVRNPAWPVAGMSWQNTADPSQHGDLEYANTLSENYWVVPLSVLQANATFDLTIRFTDGSSTALQLTSAQLATPSAQYPLK